MATIGLYRSYNFIDKDPVIDKLHAMLDKEGVKKSHASILSGVAVATITAWFEGKTRKPQHCTIMAFARGLGYDIEFAKQGNYNFERSLERAIRDEKIKQAAAETAALAEGKKKTRARARRAERRASA